MSRTPRVIHPDQPHHITLRGNNRRRLFSSRDDYEEFIYLLARGQREVECRLNVMSLMTNHAHLTLTPLDPFGISRYVKFVAQRYAQNRNLRRDASGKLFEERFYSKPITSDLQMALTTAYIELNPRQLGEAGKRLERWSTFGLHAGEPKLSLVPKTLWTPTAWYTSQGDTDEERQKAYRAWFETRAEELLVVDDVFAPKAVPDRRRFERPNRSSVL